MQKGPYSSTETNPPTAIIESTAEQKEYRTLSGLEPYSGPWTPNEIIHLLKRTMFGAKKKDIEYFKTKTLTETVSELLNPTEPLPDPPLNDYDRLGLNDVPWAATWVHAPYVFIDDENRMISFMKWTFGNFINQGRSLREKMTLFLHHHFATVADMNHSDIAWAHHNMLRINALGNFKVLTKQVTLDCHMLRFLNGEKNTRVAPNENYARELQELFCIGKGPNSKYTEEDVKQAAKILTGWKVNYDTRQCYFDPKEHDSTDKHFSSFYNNRIIKGRQADNNGETELNELIDMIFSNNETALFICRKIYRWFVYYEIDQATERNVIQPMAAIFRKNNYDLKPVLATLFKSSHFFDKVNYGIQIKSPIDFCIGMQREFDVQYLPDNRFAQNYSMWHFLIDWSGQMGQLYAFPPNVSGWPPYYQAPAYYQLWLNAVTYPKRNEFSATMIDFGYNREGYFFIIDVIHFARSLNNPEDPNALINESLEILYRIPVSAEAKNSLKKNTLLSGQAQDHYWTDAWNEYIASEKDEAKKAVVESRLKNLYRFIVNSPEYQLT